MYVIDATWLYKYFSFHVVCGNWNTLFLINVCRYFEILPTAILLLSWKQVFSKNSVFYVFYLPQCSAANNVEVIIPKFQNKAMV